MKGYGDPFSSLDGAWLWVRCRQLCLPRHVHQTYRNKTLAASRLNVVSGPAFPSKQFTLKYLSKMSTAASCHACDQQRLARVAKACPCLT